MNNVILSNWNKTIKKHDTVYFLGDLAFGRGSNNTDHWLNKLNGKIYFIKGNHDYSKNIRFLNELLINYDGHRFLLIHDPKKVRNYNDWVIHGHVHDKAPFINGDKKQINASVEVIDYKPVDLDDLILMY